MAGDEVTGRDRARFARARADGTRRAADGSGVTGARYDSRRDAIELTFRGGGAMVIARRLIPGLDRVTAATALEISPAADALSWPPADVDVYLPGLVERAFGTRLFAAATGRRGGRRRTKAKAAAAKANGAKGGRPRKSLGI